MSETGVLEFPHCPKRGGIPEYITYLLQRHDYGFRPSYVHSISIIFRTQRLDLPLGTLLMLGEKVCTTDANSSPNPEFLSLFQPNPFQQKSLFLLSLSPLHILLTAEFSRESVGDRPTTSYSKYEL